MPTRFTHISRVALLPLCGLGVLGLAAVPAHSQSLALNGSATANISGTGTTTTGSHTFGGGAGSATSSYFSVNAYNTSSLTVANGASITNLNGYDSSSITVTGGSVTNLTTGGPLSISGGILGTVDARSASSLSVSGGQFTSLTTSGANASISGGSFDFVTNTSGHPDVFTVRGGNINSLTLYGFYNLITGGDIANIHDSGPVNVVGTDLVLHILDSDNSVLTGTLQDGETIDARVIGAPTYVSLNGVPSVPEASTTVGLGLLLALGLGGMVVAARRKSL